MFFSSISHTKLHVSRQNQPLCRGWYLRFIKTRQHLAQLGAADASPLSLITDPERLTKGRIAWVYWRLRETCRAARLESVARESVWGWLVHLKSTCSYTATSCPVRSCCGLRYTPTPPSLLLWRGDSLSGHQPSLTALALSLTNYLQITWNTARKLIIKHAGSLTKEMLNQTDTMKTDNVCMWNLEPSTEKYKNIFFIISNEWN